MIVIKKLQFLAFLRFRKIYIFCTLRAKLIKNHFPIVHKKIYTHIKSHERETEKKKSEKVNAYKQLHIIINTRKEVKTAFVN